MAALDWRPLVGVDPARLQEARLQAHYAVQWLARAAQALIPAKPDDSHLNLGWEEEIGGFATHKFQGVRLGLKLFPLMLVTLEGKSNEQGRTLALDGHKDAEVRSWFGETANSLGVDAQGLDKPLPYKLPPHRIATGAPYNLTGLDAAMRELAAWYSNAAKSLARLGDAARQKKLEVVDARCWPHHFDLASRVLLEEARATIESTRSITIGMSPGDADYAEPYFYVSPSPAPPPAKLPPLAEPARWHTKGFTAAVLPAQRILAAQGRQVTVEKFLVSSFSAAFKSLH